MTDIIKKKRGKKSEKNHELFSDSHWVYIGKEGREGLGSTQGPDTLAVFVRNSKILCIGAMMDPRLGCLCCWN